VVAVIFGGGGVFVVFVVVMMLPVFGSSLPRYVCLVLGAFLFLSQ
jgi:hypothetical protein